MVLSILSTVSSLLILLVATTHRTYAFHVSKQVRHTFLRRMALSSSQQEEAAPSAAVLSASDEECAAMEEVVRRYFQGVNETDPVKIRGCFADQATIRDVCGINSSTRQVQADDLLNRCMGFLAAHPDTVVDFHYGPAAHGLDDASSSRWVVAHWYETGTWKGASCGIPPKNISMAVEAQTRFWVNENMKIQDMVVTRTFTEWEDAFLEKQRQEVATQDLSTWKEDLTKDDLVSMLQTAQEAALAAGKVIQSNTGCCSKFAEECSIKTSIKDSVTEYDQTAQAAVEEIVRCKYPEHSFLGRRRCPTRCSCQ